MSEYISKDQVASVIKESKRLEKKGKLVDALNAMDKISSLHDSKNVTISLPIAKRIGSLCNQIVLTIAAKVPYLRRAEQTLMSWLAMAQTHKITLQEKLFRVLLLTFNNWATFHQTSKNYHMALSYLMKGLKIIDESNITEPDSMQFVAKTKLNVSALYSELHRFEDAIQFAEEALGTLQAELRLRLGNKDFRHLEGKERQKAKDMILTYVIAFYNIGAAEETLHNKEAMREAYRNAVNIGSNFLDPDDELLLTAKRALIDSMGTKSKTCFPRTSRDSIRISPEMLLDIPHKSKSPGFSATVPSEIKLFKTRKSLVKNVEQHKPGRYYSDAKLKKIQQKMEDDAKLHFVSADQYFYREISKMMNIGSDIHYLRPLTTSEAKTWWERQNDEKRKISDLRLKKQHHFNAEHIDHSIVNEKIERLKLDDEASMKKQEIKVKSKMKTKVYKQLLRTITSRNKKYVFPPQSM